MTRRPTAVEPVNESMSTSTCSDRRAPTTDPGPVTTFSTPSGRPASWQICARRIVVPGVSSAGLTTAVQPTARANGSFWLMISSGKFQGVIIPTTPTGSRRTSPEHRRPEGVVGVAVGVTAQRRRVLPQVGRARDLSLRLGDRLAALERLDIGEVVRDRADAVRDAGEDARALHARHPRPRAFIERAARGRHGGVEVPDATLRIPTHDDDRGPGSVARTWSHPAHRPSGRRSGSRSRGRRWRGSWLGLLFETREGDPADQVRHRVAQRRRIGTARESTWRRGRTRTRGRPPRRRSTRARSPPSRPRHR